MTSILRLLRVLVNFHSDSFAGFAPNLVSVFASETTLAATVLVRADEPLRWGRLSAA